MPGERRPSPETQVRAALADAKRAGLDFDEAWPLALTGHVCDSYSSARGDARPEQLAAGGPPGLRTSNGQKRCAGCRFVQGAGDGVASCGLYNVPVFAGVLWPHRTDDRHEWQAAIAGSRPEWRAAYLDEPTRYGNLFEMLLARAREEAAGEVEVGGSVAA